MEDIVKELNKYPKNYWDFKGVTKKGIHNIGKYPATMVPDMQHELLKIIAKRFDNKDIILMDPFCGSGTILVIAQDIGINSIGVDINPYATLLSSVKTNVYNKNEILKAVGKLKEYLNSDVSFSNHYFYNIEKWFRKDIILSLSKIRHCIKLEDNSLIRLFFWVCLSETIFKYSNDRTSTFKLHVLPKEKIDLIADDCINFFVNRVEQNVEHLNSLKSTKSKIVCGDCCDFMKKQRKESVNVICTSPPYGDNSTTVTYGQSSILSLKWIDIKDLSCDSQIIEKYSTIDKISLGGEKKNVNNTTKIHVFNKYLKNISSKKQPKIISFFEDYYFVLKNIERILAPGGYLIMTVGNRSVDGCLQPLDDITIEIGDMLGLKLVSKFNRNILYKKTPVTISLSTNKMIVKSISEETILIFTKQE